MTIYVECKPDRSLVKLLEVTKKKILHAGNKSGVCKKLQKNTNSKGLIDEEPWSVQPPYVGELDLIYNQYNIRRLHDSQRQNYLIILVLD